MGIPKSFLPTGKDKCSQKYRLWEMLFVETAFFAAMFHDLGYPWQYVQRLSHALPGTEISLRLQHDDHAITVDDLQDRLLYHVLKGYQLSDPVQPLNWKHHIDRGIRNGFKETHGLPGAFTFLLLNDIFRDYPLREKSLVYPLRQFVIEWAAVAICMHDMKSVYQGKYKLGVKPERPFMQVDFEQDPLSAVLCLADFLQDFERHQATFEHSKCSVWKHKPTLFRFVPHCDKVSLKIEPPKMTICFHQRNHSSVSSKNHHLKTEKLELFATHSNIGYLDFSCLGIYEFDIKAEI